MEVVNTEAPPLQERLEWLAQFGFRFPTQQYGRDPVIAPSV